MRDALDSDLNAIWQPKGLLATGALAVHWIAGPVRVAQRVQCQLEARSRGAQIEEEKSFLTEKRGGGRRTENFCDGFDAIPLATMQSAEPDVETVRLFTAIICARVFKMTTEPSAHAEPRDEWLGCIDALIPAYPERPRSAVMPTVRDAEYE